jgi:hypothetical protein
MISLKLRWNQKQYITCELLPLGILPLKLLEMLCMCQHSPPKSNHRHPRRGGVNILWRWTGLWSTEAKVWGTVPKAACHWGSDSSVANDPFGAPDSTHRTYAFHPHGNLLVVTVHFPGSCGTNMDHKKSTGKNCLDKQFYGTKLLWWDFTM